MIKRELNQQTEVFIMYDVACLLKRHLEVCNVYNVTCVMCMCIMCTYYMCYVYVYYVYMYHIYPHRNPGIYFLYVNDI